MNTMDTMPGFTAEASLYRTNSITLSWELAPLHQPKLCHRFRWAFVQKPRITARGAIRSGATLKIEFVTSRSDAEHGAGPDRGAGRFLIDVEPDNH